MIKLKRSSQGLWGAAKIWHNSHADNFCKDYLITLITAPYILTYKDPLAICCVDDFLMLLKPQDNISQLENRLDKGFILIDFSELKAILETESNWHDLEGARSSRTISIEQVLQLKWMSNARSLRSPVKQMLDFGGTPPN